MMTKDGHKILIGTTLMLWFLLMCAPALIADEAWQEIEHPALDFLYSNKHRPVAGYQNVVLDSVSVWYPDEAKSNLRDATDLRQRTEESFSASIKARGLNLVTQAGDDGVIVAIQLIDLRSYPATHETPVWAKHFGFRVMPGRVTMVAEFRDAKTGQVVMHMADLEDNLRFDAASMSGIEQILARWGDAVASNIGNLPGDGRFATIVSR